MTKESIKLSHINHAGKPYWLAFGNRDFNSNIFLRISIQGKERQPESRPPHRPANPPSTIGDRWIGVGKHSSKPDGWSSLRNRLSRWVPRKGGQTYTIRPTHKKAMEELYTYSYDTEAFQHKLKSFKQPFINSIPRITSIYSTGLESWIAKLEWFYLGCSRKEPCDRLRCLGI